MQNTVEFVLFCYNQHDVVCNQKYGDNLPYSFHLTCVGKQCAKFIHLLSPKFDHSLIYKAAAGHDLIEDARITYRDIVSRVGEEVADVIYRCTEEKGKNRDERHSERYYKELSVSEPAVFVKLCDIIANVTYSILTNSTMLDKYRKEYDKTYAYLSNYSNLEPMFRHLRLLLEL